MSRVISKQGYSSIELEQSVLRIVGISLFSIYAIYLGYTGKLPDKNISQLIIYGSFYLFVSFAIFFFVVKGISEPYIRRNFGILLDIGSTSLCLNIYANYGLPLFVVYLWVTVGNGFRYGYKELILCTVLSILGFGLVVLSTTYWGDDPLLITTGFLLLSIIPLYVSILLKRLQEEKERAELASREKSRFLANISHELRTPLNAVVGFSELLGKEDSQIPGPRLIKGIQDSASSLLGLIEGVLDFSTIEAGCVKLAHGAVNLPEIVDSVHDMFAPQTRKKGIAFTCSIAQEIPAEIAGDAGRLRQIIVNLVGNAIKFTESGKVHLALERRHKGPGKDVIHFAIEDTGIGIRDEDKPFIFDRFRQADDSAQRKYGGTGLGTAISKHLVEAMGGEIGFESEYGEGSTFWFTLPYRMTGLCAQPHDNQAEPGKAVSLMNKEGEVARVLVAEDSEVNRQVFSGMLGILGVATTFANSGAAALEVLANKEIDLMILDIQMPGMSGLDVIREYMAITEISERVPIIVVTGDVTTDVQKECEQLGVSSFLAKPVELDKLREIISEHLSGKPLMYATA